MLDVFEIKNLEERWKKYKRKKNIIIFISIFAGTVVVFALFYYLSLFNKKDRTINHKNRTLLIKNENKKVVDKLKILSKPIKKINKINIEKNITKSSINIVSKKKKGENSIKSVDILHLDKKFLQQIYVNKSEDNKTKIDISAINDNAKSVKEEIKQTTKNAKIIISSKKIDKLKYFKEQYQKNPRALYAIMISKEYYKNRLYEKSLKWAILANSLDSSSEDSWIIFAKSKVKLHQKSDAINALQAYLKVNSSKRIEILLSEIKNGALK